MAAVSSETAGGLHRIEDAFGAGLAARDSEVPVYYPDTRTPFQYDRMLPPRTSQCQDFLFGTLPPPNPSIIQSQPVQNCIPPALSNIIPVPRHREAPSGPAVYTSWSCGPFLANRLDEAIAAAALTSLSSGPMVRGMGTGHFGEACAENTIISSSSSSSNSCDFYTSIPTTPSPPLLTAPLSAHSDIGLEDCDTTHFLFGDPIPRKRKNSGRLMFRCLWKNCGKVLSTSTAIQKHIRAVHLGRGGEQGPTDGEEDFYYTEMDVNVDTLTDGLSSLTPTSPTTSVPSPFLCPGSLGAANSTELPLVSPLSLSAPSTLCHVHSDHAYQAPSPISVSVTSKLSFSWQPPPLLIKAPPVPPPALNIVDKKPQILTAPPPPPPNSKQVSGTRKPRGEAKKCRKVYGMERKEMWCTACRWKKACQRFID